MQPNHVHSHFNRSSLDERSAHAAIGPSIREIECFGTGVGVMTNRHVGWWLSELDALDVCSGVLTERECMMSE